MQGGGDVKLCQLFATPSQRFNDPLAALNRISSEYVTVSLQQRHGLRLPDLATSGLSATIVTVAQAEHQGEASPSQDPRKPILVFVSFNDTSRIVFFFKFIRS